MAEYAQWLKGYQRSKDLVADGIFGEQTRKVVEEVVAVDTRYDDVKPSGYWSARAEFLNNPNDIQRLENMVSCVTETYPDRDVVDNQPWPKTKKIKKPRPRSFIGRSGMELKFALALSVTMLVVYMVGGIIFMPWMGIASVVFLPLAFWSLKLMKKHHGR
jgi:hypothetical protein